MTQEGKLLIQAEYETSPLLPESTLHQTKGIHGSQG